MDIFSMLPGDCLSKIVSLTSPVDSCRLSFVSPVLVRVAKCDLVWESFLPSDFIAIVSRSSVPLEFSSKRDLYFRLCQSILIDGCTKSFKLEKSSGKISFILSAREISITHSNNPMHWIWKPLPESRFPEVAVLRTIWRLEIRAKINTRILSPNTTYGAYLIIKISNSSYGLDSVPSVSSVEVGDNVVRSTAYLRHHSENNKQQMEHLFCRHHVEMLSSGVDVNGKWRLPRERGDGWLEVELGEFYCGGDGDDNEVKMSLKEVKGYQLKRGLAVEGIEVRPK